MAASSLRVVLHGPIALYFYPERVEAHIPDCGPEHTYCFGDWGVEYPLIKGTRLWLQGLEYSPPQQPITNFPGTLHFPARFPQGLDYPGRHSVLGFPYPSSFEAPVPCSYDPGRYRGKNVPHSKSEHVSSIHVLQYAVTDFPAITFGPWSANTIHSGSGGPDPNPQQTSLYVYADAQLPRAALAQDCRLRAVNACFSLTAGLDIEMVSDPPDTQVPTITDSDIEFLDLVERTAVLAPVLAQLRHSKPANLKSQRRRLDQPACGHGYVVTV